MNGGGRTPEDDPDKWRIHFAGALAGATLYRRRWSQPTATWGHDHCEACWAKFSDYDAPGILREGYTTGVPLPSQAGYAWVCPKCFDDLKPAMGWKAADDPAAP